MISTEKTTNLLVPRDLANSKTWHATHVSCLLHVPSFTWNCSPVSLLIMTIQKPYKGSPLKASYPVETFLPPLSLCPLYRHFLPVAYQDLLGFWNSLKELLLEPNSPHDLFFYFSPQEGTGGDWGRGLYSHGILTSPHNGPLFSCFWISHCTLPGCSYAISNKYCVVKGFFESV